MALSKFGSIASKLSPNVSRNFILRTACTEDKHPCFDDKCKKKRIPCPSLPTQKEIKEEECDEIEEAKGDPIEAVPPKKEPDPKFCDTVDRLTGEKKFDSSGSCCKKPQRGK